MVRQVSTLMTTFVMFLFVTSIIPATGPGGKLDQVNGEPSLVSSFTVSGWTFPWDEPTIESISDWQDSLDEVSPYWYWILQNGTIQRTHNETEDLNVITFLHQKDIDLIPMISNNHDTETINEISRNVSFQTQHIQDIIDLIRQFSYAGVDINYENIPTSEKDGYANFIMNLSEAIHGIGKKLYVSVFPKVAEDENREGPGGYDYERIGTYADRVRIMAYNLHWSTAPTSGPITSLEWLEEIFSYAVTAMPRHRIQLGVPQYGYDWVVNKDGKRLELAENVTFSNVLSIQKEYNVERKWNSTSRTPYIEYKEKSGKLHHLHYSDSESLMHQMKFIGEMRLDGVAIWKIGGEDPDSSYYIKKYKENGLADLPPFIDLGFSSITGFRGLNISFSPVRVYDIEDELEVIIWDLGDGNVTHLLEPTHRYTKGGIFKASLLVKDTSGLETFETVDVRIGPFATFDFEYGPDENKKIKLNGTGSWDPEGIMSYTWDMGDGSYLFHSDPVIEHVYERPGFFNISLTIINKQGFTDVYTRSVEIIDDESPIADAGADVITYEGYQVTLDARGSYDNSGSYNCTWSIEGIGVMRGYVVQFMPSGPGQYDVDLSVMDSYGNYDVDHLLVTVLDSTSPIVDIIYPEWVELGGMIEINASGCVDNIGVVNYTWDLGNGNIMYGSPVISFRATEAKRYYCTLNICDEEGNWNSSTFFVEVRDIKSPSGHFKIDPTPRDLNESYAYELMSNYSFIITDLEGVILSNTTYIFSVNDTKDDSEVGSITWFFGDGHSAGGPIVYHEYDMPGLYRARLKITDIWGNQNNSNISLLVVPAWNQTLNEIETILHEYRNNTFYVEEEHVEDEGPIIDLWPFAIIIGILTISIFGLFEMKKLFYYGKEKTKELISGSREGVNSET